MPPCFPFYHPCWPPFLFVCLFLLSFSFPVIVFCLTELMITQHPTKQVNPYHSIEKVTDLTWEKVQLSLGWVCLLPANVEAPTSCCFPHFTYIEIAQHFGRPTSFHFYFFVLCFGFKFISKNKAEMFLLCHLHHSLCSLINFKDKSRTRAIKLPCCYG